MNFLDAQISSSLNNAISQLLFMPDQRTDSATLRKDFLDNPESALVVAFPKSPGIRCAFLSFGVPYKRSHLL